MTLGQDFQRKRLFDAKKPLKIIFEQKKNGCNYIVNISVVIELMKIILFILLKNHTRTHKHTHAHKFSLSDVPVQLFPMGFLISSVIMTH